MSPRTVDRIIMIPIIISTVGIILFAILAGIFEFLGENSLILGLLVVSFILRIACILPQIIFYNTTLIISPNSVIISEATGKIWRVVTEEFIVWKGTYAGQGFTVIPLKVKVASIDMEVSPITPNPKVRKIRYTVEVTGIFDNANKLQLFLNKMWGSGIKLWSEWRKTLTDIVEYQLYELNNAKSNELAEFHNPRDENQQARFQTLIANFLNPILKKSGLVVKSASFQLA